MDIRLGDWFPRSLWAGLVTGQFEGLGEGRDQADERC